MKMHSHGLSPSVTRGVAVMLLLAATGWVRQVTAADAPGMVGAGIVSELLLDPLSPMTLYTVTECGGVVKSTDGGGTWRTANTGLFLGDIRALAIDPITPSRVYAGSGDRLGASRSTDSGDTWQSLVHADVTVGAQVLAIDPITPSTLYAALYGGGLLKSTDSGSSWQTANAGLPNAPVSALAIDPRTPSRLYALADYWGVYKSTDGGSSWQFAPIPPPIGPTPTPAPNTGLPAVGLLAIDPTTPSTLYAGTVSFNSSGGMVKSTDGASTWHAVTGLSYGPVYAIAIDPQTSGTLYVSTGSGGGVFKSTDGGLSWQAINSGLPLRVLVDTLAVDPKTPSTLYAGLSYTAYVDGQLPAGGVFKSTDGGSTWSATGLAGEPICGDGVQCRSEECDDGNTVSGDGCDANCTGSRCGNGIVAPPEECDDGNYDPYDGCTNACTICGNGMVAAGEECDDGNRNNNDGCTNACVRNVCGDGFRNPATEECDDANYTNTDTCRNDCKLNVCGDGFVNPTAEQCDDGNTSNTDACRNDCQANICGDGFLHPATEQCDDGNLIDGDGCDSNCTPTGCGNGIVSAGEQCDDGNRNPYDGCTNNCTRCGDGIITPPEQCDDGNNNPFDGCTNACTICGNGLATFPEHCDDGNLVNGDGCDADCIGPVCGNGRVDAGEECDDGGICVGGAAAGTACTSQQCPGGECQTFGGDDCAANCTIETRKVFRWSPGQIDQSNNLVSGSSGAVIHGGIFNIPLPISGSLTLTTGKATAGSSGDVPVVVRAEDFHAAPIRVLGLGCLCLGAAVSPAFGPGNAGGGTIACAAEGLANTDITTSIDHNIDDSDPLCAQGTLEGTCAKGICQGSRNAGSACGANADCVAYHPGVCNGSEFVTFSGSGPAGSAVIEVSLASWSIGDGGSCSVDQGDPRKGADGIPCNDDDPARSSTVERYCGIGGGGSVGGRGRGGGSCPLSFLPSHLQVRLTTGTARATVLDANNELGSGIADDRCSGDPCLTATSGRPFDCAALAVDSSGEIKGAALAAAFGILDNAGIGDAVTTMALATPFCAGDCHGDGQVTIDELLTMVNMALGTAQPSACPHGVPSGGDVNVAMIIQAVNSALSGCGASQ